MLTEKQQIAVRLLAAGFTQREVASRLRYKPVTIAKWLRKSEEFGEALRVMVLKRNEIFEAEFEALASLITWRLRDIILQGTDANAIKAIDLCLRTKVKSVKYLTQIDQEEIERPTSEEDIDEYVAALEETYGFRVVRHVGGKKGSSSKATKSLVREEQLQHSASAS